MLSLSAYVLLYLTYKNIFPLSFAQNVEVLFLFFRLSYLLHSCCLYILFVIVSPPSLHFSILWDLMLVHFTVNSSCAFSQFQQSVLFNSCYSCLAFGSALVLVIDITSSVEQSRTSIIFLQYTIPHPPTPHVNIIFDLQYVQSNIQVQGTHTSVLRPFCYFLFHQVL